MTSMPGSRAGITLVVAGGAGEIGQAVAALLAQRLGADDELLLLDRNAARLDDAVRALGRDPGAQARAVALDLADVEQVDAVFTDAAQHRRIAGVAIAVGTTTPGSIEDATATDWEAVQRSCLTTVFAVLRASVRAMPDRGSICVVGSVQAAQPMPGFAAYAAAKAGVVALSRQVALEYGRRGLRVNVVTPGWTRTKHTEGRLDTDDEAHLHEATPLPRLVEPRDIAAAVDFLLSPAADAVTGAELVVDAGAGLVPGASLLREQPRRLLGLELLG